MGLTTLTNDELYREVADVARDQGITDREMWHELVEEIMEDHLDLGELDLDQDIEQMKEALRGMWGRYRQEGVVDEEALLEDDDKADQDDADEGV